MSMNSVKDAFFLYVEDDAPSRKVVSLLLKNALGVKDFAIFESSMDFLASVKALPRVPDIILLDIHVRPYDGFEMLRILRSDPDYRLTKVIALTASVMNEEIEKLRQAGFNGAIGKPLSISMFPHLIERILNNEAVWQV